MGKVAPMSEQNGEVDFALAAFRDDGTWRVQDIAPIPPGWRNW